MATQSGSFEQARQRVRAALTAMGSGDLLVFTGKNDLVVDTESMIDTGGGPTHIFENPADVCTTRTTSGRR